jgi:hypothetical protein
VRLGLLVLLLSINAGCSTLFCSRASKCSKPSSLAPTELPTTVRSKLRFDCQLAENYEVTATQIEARAYRQLTPHACIDLAKKNSVVANLIQRDLDSRLKQPYPFFGGAKERYELIIAIMQGTILETQNRSAAAAMELYYRIVEVEAQADLAAQSVKLLTEFDASVQQLVNAKLANQQEVSVTEIKLDEARAAQRKVQIALDELNEKLQGMLGVRTPGFTYRIWPDVAPAIAQEQLNTAALTQQALQARPDLQLLRTLVQATNTQTFVLINQIIGNATPIVEVPSHLAPFIDQLQTLLSACIREERVEKNREQARRLLSDREDLTRREIERTVFSIYDRLQLIALTGKKRNLIRDRIKQLSPLAEKELKKRPELLQAQLDQIKACGDVIHEMIEHEILRVKLREALGDFVR